VEKIETKWGTDFISEKNKVCTYSPWILTPRQKEIGMRKGTKESTQNQMFSMVFTFHDVT
jgi:hypothetical protein